MSPRSRWLLLIAVLALLAVACGDAGSEPTAAPTTAAAVVESAPTAVPPATDPTTATTAPAATTTPPTTEAAPTLLTSTVDGPEAPNFALTLGTGTDQFVLGEVNKPVYLVYWADW